LLGDVGEHAWHVGEQVCTQPFGGRLYDVRLTLVVGQRLDEAQNVRLVAGSGGPDRSGHAT